MFFFWTCGISRVFSPLIPRPVVQHESKQSILIEVACHHPVESSLAKWTGYPLVKRTWQENQWNFEHISWIWPPPCNSGKWRLIGIPYNTCNSCDHCKGGGNTKHISSIEKWGDFSCHFLVHFKISSSILTVLDYDVFLFIDHYMGRAHGYWLIIWS